MIKTNENRINLFSHLAGRKKIIFYGINSEMTPLLAKLKSIMSVSKVCDSDEVVFADEFLAGQMLGASNIISLHESIELLKNRDYLLIITANNPQIKHKTQKRLLLEGFSENIDFFTKDIFEEIYLSMWAWHAMGISYSDTINLSANFTCTLNCKNCSVSIPYLHEKNPEDSRVFRDMDRIFEIFDYIYDFDITGGETFIISDKIADIIVRLYEKYSDRFNRITIVTNATIIPSDKCLNVLKKYGEGIRVIVSEYKPVEGWEEKAKKFYSVMEENGIQYMVAGLETWVDFGFMDTKVDGSKKELETYFDMCNDPCRLLLNGRLYWCAHGYGAQKAFYSDEIKESDSLDIYDCALSKEDFLEWMLGICQNGYPAICAHCNGYGEWRNRNYIPVAEQL